MVCITMNNAQKNSFVRQRITDTLIEMLKEKSLQEISVSDLTARAGVGRVSFYRNYSDKEDVLRQESARLLQQWGILFESGQGNEEYNRVFLSLFDYLRQNRAFYTVLCSAGLSDILMDTVVATARLNPDMPNLEAYLKSFWAYGIFGWIKEWIQRGMTESGEELERLFALWGSQMPEHCFREIKDADQKRPPPPRHTNAR